ncbi:MAG: ATP-binding protein [Phaeodactylibacter sp.]|uniref:ATP-binding protein n=1 Tax=Phaeodactylibacter sp. TaxID=1940289 RepID=UPI0032EAB8D3
MIKRHIEPAIASLVGKFPVLTITGPRQSGKTTLIRNLFGDLPYFSLESPDVYERIVRDPRELFATYGHRMILDEVQRAPQLLSYIQGIVDDHSEALFILSGSHNMLMMEGVSQTLAGRTAIFYLHPLSYAELKPYLPTDLSANHLCWQGGYPRIYDKSIPPPAFYQSYLATYVERDVRQIKNISNLDAFTRFVSICAGFIGQTINKSTLASAAGIDRQTASAWLSVLRTSHILYTVQPYFRNFKKRLVKSSKLYFRDTGLACALLGINTAEQLLTYYQRGAIFENFIFNEVSKSFYNNGLTPPVFFWRDNSQHEIDLLLNVGGQIRPIEIKSGTTYRNDYFKQLDWFSKTADVPLFQPTVIYGGEDSQPIGDHFLMSWREVGSLVA